jgi:autophagy-related protein 11
MDDENPFELSDGLRWYLLDAVEEKSGAPTTPGLSSSTVASANVDAKGSLRSRKPITGAKKKLSEITTEHSRRSSSGSGHRNSVSLTADVVKAAVEGGASVVVDSVPSTPRTPVEKIVAGVRSRAGSIRSRTPAPEAQR